MTEAPNYDRRLGKVESDILLLSASMENLSGDLRSFRKDWAEKAEEDRAAHRSARLGPAQLVGMGAALVTMTAILLGGLMYLINAQVGTTRADLAARIDSANQGASGQLAQVGLTVRGQGDSVTALNTALQQLQREQALDRVKLGLVEQAAALNSRFIDQAQGYDAMMARQDEKLRAMEQFLRDQAARRPGS